MFMDGRGGKGRKIVWNSKFFGLRSFINHYIYYFIENKYLFLFILIFKSILPFISLVIHFCSRHRNYLSEEKPNKFVKLSKVHWIRENLMALKTNCIVKWFGKRLLKEKVVRNEEWACIICILLWIELNKYKLLSKWSISTEQTDRKETFIYIFLMLGLEREMYYPLIHTCLYIF